MKKHSKAQGKRSKPSQTVGIDVGDKYCSYCVLNGEGEVVEKGRLRTQAEAFRRHFGGERRMRVAMECGTHSPWISRLLEELGHEVLVGNARKLEAVTGSESKNDERDAEQLAILAHFEPRLLYAIRHRSAQRQQDLSLIQARAALVRARTLLINTARGLVKSSGGRLPPCSSQSFATQVQAKLPAELSAGLAPLVNQVGSLNAQIARMDEQVEGLIKKYPEIRILRSVPGVGPLVAATYVLTLDSVQAVGHSRSAGAFLGLRPRQKQSGRSDPQCAISKTGNTYLRSLLVQSAHYILGRFGPDSALRRWGLRLASSGGKRGKKRAVVAVARKLSVILHAIWRSGKVYQCFPQSLESVPA